MIFTFRDLVAPYHRDSLQAVFELCFLLKKVVFKTLSKPPLSLCSCPSPTLGLGRGQQFQAQTCICRLAY